MRQSKYTEGFAPGLCWAYRRDLINKTSRGPTPEVVALWKRQEANEKQRRKDAEVEQEAAYAAAGISATPPKKRAKAKNGVEAAHG